MIEKWTDCITDPRGAWAEIERLRTGLRRIADLEHVTQTRGPLEHIGAPDHLLDVDGWGPIDGRMKAGLEYAARIAKEYLPPASTKEAEHGV